MAMRLTGLMSGMDTESIIQELVAVKRTKVDDAKRAQTKLSWKQDAWKSLNSKLKNLQSKYLSSMRFTSAYSKRITKVSNDSVVSVITGKNAVNGVQSLKVNEMAKRGFLTGAELSGGSAGKLTALSKLSDIKNSDGTSAFSGGTGTINVTSGDKSVDITINEDTTISDVLTQVKNAGLNANFDANNQRFYISSKESGKAGDFSITALDAAGEDALSALGLKTSLAEDEATLAKYKEYAGYYVENDKAATLANMQQLISDATTSRVSSYLEKYKGLMTSKKAAEDKIQEINDKYADSPLAGADTYAAQLEAKNTEIEEMEARMAGLTDPDQVREAEQKLVALKEEAADLTTKKTDAETLAAQQESLSGIQSQIDEVTGYVDITSSTDADGNTTYSAEATDTLKKEVGDTFYKKAEYAAGVIKDYESAASNQSAADGTGATKVSGQDAVITLNGAKYTNSTNTFEINGLTFTVLNKTSGDEEVTVTTQDDVDGIYDMVKNFLKEYNSIINEMDKLYNADPARGYEPLTDEEKDAMSESEAEKYEEKIKDALLRRDSNLSTVSSAMKEIMMSGVTINGKSMHLSDFGISTLSYFSSAENEKNAYHIDGDEDDGHTSSQPDKLKSMISNDPDTVISFFAQLSKNLYDKMSELSSSVKDSRSFGSFYDDKKMKTEYDKYKSNISDLEDKLADYEDKWYAKFAKMETAIAKMQKNMSAVTGLLGG